MSAIRIRLVITTYLNHLEWEDGPGSLQNVVSDASSQYQSLGTMTMAEAEALTRNDLDEIYNVYFEEDSADGFEEYSYKLEYFDNTTLKWRLVKVFW